MRFKREGVINDSNQKLEDLPLHEVCPDSARCWSGCETTDELAEWNKIQIPFVGPYYWSNPASRLLVVGLNIHQSGGLFFLIEMVVHAQSILQSGYKKVHFAAEGYGGTLFWHRLAAYCRLFIRDDWDVRQGDVWLGKDRLSDDAEALAEVLNHIAFTEAIKCSPQWERSTPSEAMWDHCPRRFLTRELELLKPAVILVLGLDTLRTLPFQCGEPVAVANDGRVRMFDVDCESGPILVVNVIHPAAPGGASEELLVDLAGLVKTLRRG